MRGLVLTLSGLILFSGCSRPAPDKPVRAANEALLEPIHLKERPAAARSVREVIASAADGQEVIVAGLVPPRETEPFLEDRAGFFLHAPEDLENLPECLEPG